MTGDHADVARANEFTHQRIKQRRFFFKVAKGSPGSAGYEQRADRYFEQQVMHYMILMERQMAMPEQDQYDPVETDAADDGLATQFDPDRTEEDTDQNSESYSSMAA